MRRRGSEGMFLADHIIHCNARYETGQLTATFAISALYVFEVCFVLSGILLYLRTRLL